MLSYPPGRVPTRSEWTRPQDIHENTLEGWSPSPGKLQRLLQVPEYNLFGDTQIFESNFLQVTKSGQFIDIHKQPNEVIIGILASSPKLFLPDLMIVAREKQGAVNKKLRSTALEITRLIPLDLVEIFVCDLNKRQLKVQLVTGQKYYLQLSSSGGNADVVFERWVRLIYLMRLATGKLKPLESVPLKKAEPHAIQKNNAQQAVFTKRPPPREQLPHSVPKLKKESAAKQSAAVQSKSQKQPPSKLTSHPSPAQLQAGFKHSGAFLPWPIALPSAADHLKSVKHPYLEIETCPPLGISGESNLAPVTLKKSKKEMCLRQKTTLTSSLEGTSKVFGEKEPVPTSEKSGPGSSKLPEPPSQRKEGPAIRSQLPEKSHPAATVETKRRATLVAADPSKVVQRNPKAGLEKEGTLAAPFQLANQSQDGKPNKIVKNEPRAFPNFPPVRGHPTSQEKEAEQQVHRVTMSIAVGTAQVDWKTVAVGPSVAVDPDLSNPPNKQSITDKPHEEQSKARRKTEMSRIQVSESKNILKTAINTAKQRSSLKFVILYSKLSASVERLKKSKSKGGTKEKKMGDALVVGEPGIRGLDRDSKKPATVVVKKVDFPPALQPQKSMSRKAIKPQAPSTREGILKTAEPIKAGNQVAAKEPGVTGIASQAPCKNTNVGQCSVPGLVNQEAIKKTLTASRTPEKPSTVATPLLEPEKKRPLVAFSHPLPDAPKSSQSSKAPRKT